MTVRHINPFIFFILSILLSLTMHLRSFAAELPVPAEGTGNVEIQAEEINEVENPPEIVTGINQQWSIYYVSSAAELEQAFSITARQSLAAGHCWYSWIIVTQDIYLDHDLSVYYGCIRLSTSKGATIYTSGTIYSYSYIAFSNANVCYSGSDYLAVASGTYAGGDNCVTVEGSSNLYGLSGQDGQLQSKGIILGQGPLSRVNFYSGTISNATNGILCYSGKTSQITGGTVSNCINGYTLSGNPNIQPFRDGASVFGFRGGAICNCDNGCIYKGVDSLYLPSGGSITDCSSTGLTLKGTKCNVTGLISSCDTGIDSEDNSSVYCRSSISNCQTGLISAGNSTYITSGCSIFKNSTAIVNKTSLFMDSGNIHNNVRGLNNQGSVYQTGGAFRDNQLFSIYQHGIYHMTGNIGMDTGSGPIKLSGNRILLIDGPLTNSDSRYPVKLVGDSESDSLENDGDNYNYKQVGRTIAEAYGSCSNAELDKCADMFTLDSNDTPSQNASAASVRAFNGVPGSAALLPGSSSSIIPDNVIYYSARYYLNYNIPAIGLDSITCLISAYGQDCQEFSETGYYGQSAMFNNNVDGNSVSLKFYRRNEDSDSVVESKFLSFSGWTKDINLKEGMTCDPFEMVLTENANVYGAYQAGDNIDLIYRSNQATGRTDGGSPADIVVNLKDISDVEGYITIADNPYLRSTASSRYDDNLEKSVSYNTDYSFVGWYEYDDEGVKVLRNDADEIVTYMDELHQPGDKVLASDLICSAISENRLHLYNDGSASIELFAVWDQYPTIDADYIYISDSDIDELDEGIIIDLSKAVCNDREEDHVDGDKYIGLSPINDLSLIKSELHAVGQVGAVSAQLMAHDSIGNEAYYTIMIYVTTNSELDHSRTFVRFVDQENYKKGYDSDGKLIDRESDGALMGSSIWYLQDKSVAISNTGSYNESADYVALINNAFDRLNSADYSISLDFSHDDIVASQNYVSDYGPGNYENNSDNLAGWLSLMAGRSCIDESNYRELNDSNEYTVMYNANIPAGCSSTMSGHMNNDLITAGDRLSPCAYSLPGYIFTGWCTAPDGLGKTYKDGQKMTRISPSYGTALVLYATWRPVTYTVSFDGNGASAGQMSDMYMNYDRQYQLPENKFERSDISITFMDTDGNIYTSIESATAFSGWALSSNGSIAYDDKALVTNLTTDDSIRLYAVWQSEAITLPLIERPGYIFTGWSLADVNVGLGGSLYTPTNNCTLYPTWEAVTYDVTFDSNLPVGASDDISGQQNAISCNIENPVITIPECNLSLKGYTFAGWSTKEDIDQTDCTIYQSGDKVTISASTIMYAVWIPNNYVISFESNLPPALIAAEVEPMLCQYGITYVLPDISPSVSDESYSFIGWNTMADGSGEWYGMGTSLSNLTEIADAAFTLYAMWDHIEAGSINVSAEKNDNGISLQWESVSNASYYRLLRNDSVLADALLEANCIDANPEFIIGPEGYTVSYMIQACDADGRIIMTSSIIYIQADAPCSSFDLQ